MSCNNGCVSSAGKKRASQNFPKSHMFNTWDVMHGWHINDFDDKWLATENSDSHNINYTTICHWRMRCLPAPQSKGSLHSWRTIKPSHVALKHFKVSKSFHTTQRASAFPNLKYGYHLSVCYNLSTLNNPQLSLQKSVAKTPSKLQNCLASESSARTPPAQKNQRAVGEAPQKTWGKTNTVDGRIPALPGMYKTL